MLSASSAKLSSWAGQSKSGKNEEMLETMDAEWAGLLVPRYTAHSNIWAQAIYHTFGHSENGKLFDSRSKSFDLPSSTWTELCTRSPHVVCLNALLLYAAVGVFLWATA